MLNIIGNEINDYRSKKIPKGHYFYDYQKKLIKDGRKMGHLTKII
jgi:5-(carboxyamino)imidazole ribonucleotide synthase